MPETDRDFICFGMSEEERTGDEIAWEAQIDLMGGCARMCAAALKQEVEDLLGCERPTRELVVDLVNKVLDEWRRTRRTNSSPLRVHPGASYHRWRAEQRVHISVWDPMRGATITCTLVIKLKNKCVVVEPC